MSAAGASRRPESVGRRLRRHVLRPDLEAHQRTRFPKTGRGDFRIAGELDTLTCQPSEVRFPLRDTLNGGLPMKSSTFTTQNLKPSDQLQSWHEWLFPAFDITRLDFDDPFEAQNSLWKLGDLIVSRVLAPSVHVKRTKANVKKSAGEGNASSFAHFCKL